MSPLMRTMILVSGAIGLALWIGYGIAQEEFEIATLAAALSLMGLVAWSRGPRVEAWIAAALLFCYILGNRGFAQVNPISGVPLFFGELGLGFAMAILVFRHAMQRDLPVQPDWLNRLILLWIVVGAGRIIFDVRAYGFVALRDFATVYYACFFFIGQSVTAHAGSHRLLPRTLTVTFCLLPLLSLGSELLPDFFGLIPKVQGVPVILYKGDLLATFQFAGFFWLLPRGPTDWRRDGWRWGFAVLSLLLGLANLSRAGMAGLLVALGWLALARSWRAVRTVVVVSIVGLLGVTLSALVQGGDVSQTRAYAVLEHVRSIGDFSGTMAYRNPDSADSGDNNRFRLVWWRTVAEETLTGGPLLGLGFGYDLARGFVRNYDPLMDTDFTARSPHSIVMTVFGRMGFVGLAAWGGIMAAFSYQTWRLTHRAGPEDGREQQRPLMLAALCWVVLISACFGVVLEGPMGAIPFWTMLGLWSGETARAAADSARPPAAAPVSA